MTKLTRNDVIERLSDSTGLPRSSVELLLSSIVDLASKNVSDGFLLPGLGEFVIAPGPERTIRNPAVGEWMTIPGNPMVKFVPDSEAFEKLVEQSPEDMGPSRDAPNTLHEMRLHHDEADWVEGSQDFTPSESAKHKLGGHPDWVQGDETPICCARQMTFYGQLDSRVGGSFNVMDSAVIFVFVCEDCSRSRAVTQSY